MRTLLCGVLAALLLAACGTTAPDSPAAARLAKVGDFDEPIHVTAPSGDPRLFVVQRGGEIRVVRDDQTLSQPFLDVSGRTDAGGEQGLFSMAFAPDYAQSGLFYVSYTDQEGDNRVTEFRVSGDPDRADAGSAREVIDAAGFEPNHNGGLITFGPDGNLYIGLGDGGAGNDPHGARGHGQDLGALQGKILRIDPKRSGDRPYSIPDDNPFRGRSGAAAEVWAYGLRNPWRFSFDRANGALSVADVGQDAIEEVSYLPFARAGGANFGWRPFEGRKKIFPGESAPGHVKPVVQESHDDGWCSITGGVVVRDPRSSLRGRYLYGDLCQSSLSSVKFSRGKATGKRRLGLKVDQFVSMGEDAQGRAYVVSLSGPVYRLIG